MDPSACLILVVHCRKLQTSEDQMTIPAELIHQAKEVPVDTMVCDIYPLDVMAAPRKSVCLTTSMW